jgi:hypothetical protein
MFKALDARSYPDTARRRQALNRPYDVPSMIHNFPHPGGAALCWLASVSLYGCAYRVQPPDCVREPVTVVIVDHGLHSSLVMPRGGALAVEYAYGQWDWFVLDRTAWYRAPGTLLLPGKAGLGRRELAAPAITAHVQAAIVAENYHELIVDRARVAALLAKLDTRFAARSERTLNPRLGLEFVEDPQPYSLLHHCNTQVVDWLRDLGCRVTGLGPDAVFEVVR